MLSLLEQRVQEWTWRQYQLDAMEAASQKIWNGALRILLGLPTGAGKTMIAGGLLRRLLKHKRMHALFLVPNVDLVIQTKNKLLMLGFDEKDIGILQGQIKQYGKQITIACVATIQRDETLQRYLESVGGEVDVLIADECHYAAATTWRKVIDTALPPWGILIGMSATPYRSDEQNLQQIFTDGYAYVIDIWELITQEHLADMDTDDLDVEMNPEELKRQVDTEVRKARREKQDVSDWKAFRADAAKVISDTHRYEMVYQWWLRNANGMRTLIFGETVEDARGFVEYFEKKGIPGAVVTGSTSKEERQTLYGDPVEFWGEKQYSKFDRGEILILANYGVLTTGNDITSIECIIMGRPTNSRGLWMQCLGRGLRMCKRIGKTRVKVLNITDKHHTVMMFKHLFGVMETKIKSVKKLITEKLEKEERQRYEFELEEQKIISGEASVRKTNLFMGEGWKHDAVMDGWEKECVIDGKHQVLIAEKIVPGRYQPICIDETGKSHPLSDEPMTSIEARIKCQQYLEEQTVMSEYAPRKKEWNGADPIDPDQMNYLIQRKIHFERPGKEKLTSEDMAELAGKITKAEYSQMTGVVHAQGRAINKYGLLCYIEGLGVRVRKNGEDRLVPKGAYSGYKPTTNKKRRKS